MATMRTTLLNSHARNERQHAANAGGKNDAGEENENKREIAHLLNSLNCVAENKRPSNADRDKEAKEQKPVESIHVRGERLL